MIRCGLSSPIPGEPGRSWPTGCGCGSSTSQARWPGAGTPARWTGACRGVTRAGQRTPGAGGPVAGRRYSCPVDVVLQVRDDLMPSNAGRWRLATTASGSDAGRGLAASCVRVTSAADVALDITQLGAAYLGGTRLGALAEAGLVAELRPGQAVRRANV